MKKTAKIALLIGTLLISEAAFAQATPPSKATPRPNEEKVRERMLQNSGAQFGNNSTGTPTTTVNKIKEKRNQFLQNQLARMIEKFKAAVTRLEKISTRIQERIDILKNEGLNMTEAQTALNSAKTKITDAKNSVSSLTTSASNLINSEDPKKAFADLRALMNTSKEKIRAAHEALVDTINILKPGSKRSILNKTSTTTNP
jgi:prophage DNA circulation protein